MKKIITAIIGYFCFFSLLSFSQYSDDYLKRMVERRNIIDLEIAGTSASEGVGIFLNLNYSRILLVKKRYFVNTTIGIGPLPFKKGIALPHQITLNFGKENDFLEIGIGGTYWRGNSESINNPGLETSYQYYPYIGYRRHRYSQKNDRLNNDM